MSRASEIADLRCPSCRMLGSQVYNSRGKNRNTFIWRRRRCINCDHRWSTIEMNGRVSIAELAKLIEEGE